MIQYFSDSERRGVIMVKNSYDGYVWDYDSQMWIPHHEAACAARDKCSFVEITPEETEKIIWGW